MIRTVIIDDEPVARSYLRTLLEAQGDFTVVQECRNGDEAVESFRAQQPDLAFLDVQMPGMNGFDVLASCTAAERPSVVFVTAYDEFALRAFEVHALDYLLKPFDEERFQRTAERVRAHLRKDPRDALQVRIESLLDELRRHTTRSYLERFTIKDKDQTFVVRVEDVDWIESDGNYVVLHCGHGTHLLRASLAGVARSLDPKRFARIHRTVVVNVGRIQRLVSRRHGDYAVHLRDGTQLTLSRRYRRQLHDVLKPRET